VPRLGTLGDFQRSEQLLRARSRTDTLLAREILAHAKDALLSRLIPPPVLEEIISAADAVVATRKLSAERLAGYVERIEGLEKHRRLDPLFAAARRAERDFDFLKAEDYYRQLHKEYQGNAIHAPLFQGLIARYASINKSLRMLSDSARANDFLDARAHLRHLKRKYQGVPWENLVELPVQISTQPSGASVRCDGQLVGVTPLSLLCAPGLQTRIQIEHTGFLPERRTLQGDELQRLRLVLTRAPLWTMKTKGAMEQQPAVDRDRIYMVDRSGAASGWSRHDGLQQWRRSFDDLSGLLTAPVLFEERVLVGSLDGPLRALDASTGRVLWELPDLPMESAPCRLGDDLVAVTTDRRLVVVDTNKRALRWDKPLGASTALALHAVGDCAVIVLDDGTLRSISIPQEVDRWPAIRLDPGVVAQPLVQGHVAVICTDEGHVSAYDLRAGTRLWHRADLGELRWRPTARGARVFLTAPATGEHPARVLSLNLRSGQSGPSYEASPKTAWSCAPAVLGRTLLLSTRAGSVLAIDAETLRLRSQIRGRGEPCARPAFLAPNQVLCSFDGKEVLILPILR